MGEARRRKKLDSNWGKLGKSRQNPEAGTTDDCHFNLSLEKSLYWINAINTYETSDETMKFILELATISPFFIKN
ncbi:MAG: hypothetical protein QNJ60_13540 [Xenococcaceae cyanobacterium MO_188.B19]|nr:hypothetical protein [Xenococcaceae cyanobacterium MO_188.B19]